MVDTVIKNLDCPKAVLFRRLPLGTRFRYIGSNVVWVVLERHGYGLIAKWCGNVLDFDGQTVACAGDSEETVSKLKVEPVDVPVDLCEFDKQN